MFVLRKLLRDGPESEPYITTVPRRGYRFVRAVRKVPSSELSSLRDSVRPRRAWRVALGATVALAVLAMVGLRPIARGFDAEALILGTRIRVTVQSVSRSVQPDLGASAVGLAQREPRGATRPGTTW